MKNSVLVMYVSVYNMYDPTKKSYIVLKGV